jgi:hypothetical protein
MAAVATQQVHDPEFSAPPRAWPTGSRALQHCILTWDARLPCLRGCSMSHGLALFLHRTLLLLALGYMFGRCFDRRLG